MQDDFLVSGFWHPTQSPSNPLSAVFHLGTACSYPSTRGTVILLYPRDVVNPPGRSHWSGTSLVQQTCYRYLWGDQKCPPSSPTAMSGSGLTSSSLPFNLQLLAGFPPFSSKTWSSTSSNTTFSSSSAVQNILSQKVSEGPNSGDEYQVDLQAEADIC